MFNSIDAASMYGMMPNMYYNQVALNDLSNMNLSYPSTFGFDPLLSMNGSIFGGMTNPYMMNPMMGQMMNPYMPCFNGNSIENYYNNWNKYQDLMIDNGIKRQEKMREADLRLNSPQEGIQKQVELLRDKILTNEQEQIKIAYTQFVNSVKSMYPNASAEEIENRADKIYQEVTRKSLYDDIRENGRDSFTQGMLQTITFGFADGKTAEENISDLTGLPVGRMENAKKVAGNIAGGAVVGGATMLGTSLLFKCLKIGAKSKTFWGILAGTAAGIAAAIIGNRK